MMKVSVRSMKIILASSSPRRKELLEKLGYPFEIIVKNTKEVFDQEKDVYEALMDVAYQKAYDVFKDIKGDVIVIGSDTIVHANNKVIGKPKDLSEAYQMIKMISGKSHEVVTSLCLLIRKDGKEYKELTYDKSIVKVMELTDIEIYDWINNNDVLTRAGAYAIQDGFAKYIEGIEGDYFSIVGLPIHKLYLLLKKYL